MSTSTTDQVDFLSGPWLTAMTAVLRSSDEFRGAAGHADFVYAHAVSGGPGGDLTYLVSIHGGEAALAPGDASDADVVIATDYPTAVEIARGELSLQNAYMGGRVHLSGDTGAIFANQAVLAVLDSLRDRVPTRYVGT